MCCTSSIPGVLPWFVCYQTKLEFCQKQAACGHWAETSDEELRDCWLESWRLVIVVCSRDGPPYAQLSKELWDRHGQNFTVSLIKQTLCNGYGDLRSHKSISYDTTVACRPWELTAASRFLRMLIAPNILKWVARVDRSYQNLPPNLWWGKEKRGGR